MALKSYNEMRKIDISPYLKNRDGKFPYLPWKKCVDLLHDNGAEKVFFNKLVDEKTGSSLFKSDKEFTDKSGNTNSCYEVAVEIIIDDLSFVMRTPVMNGSNPVKDNSMSQQRLNNAQARAFVKGVAIMTGLGIDLWDDDYEENTNAEDDLYKHSIQAIKQRVQQTYTALYKKGMSTEDIASALGMSEDSVKATFTYFDLLDKFEKDLEKL